MRFSRILLVAAVLIVVFVLVVAVIIPGTDADKLGGTQWRLVSYGAPDAPTLLVPDSEVTLNFKEDNQVDGRGGCNGYWGSYFAGDEAITFTRMSSTLLGCTFTGEQEQVFFEALLSASRYTVSGNTLTITYSGGQLNFVST